MSAPIGPGDWVECVKADFFGGDTIVKGGIYCVEAILPNHGWCPLCKDYCADVVLTTDVEKDIGWCPGRFRPIYRPKAELIEVLKKPVELPEDERVPA